MNWPDIKKSLQTASSKDCVYTFLGTQNFWNSNEKDIFRTAWWLLEHQMPDATVHISDAVRIRGYQLSPVMKMNFHYLRGNAWFELKEYQKARDEFSEIIVIEATDVALCNRALASEELGDEESALNDYLKAFEMNAASKEAAWGIARKLNNLGRYAEAIDKINIAITIDPNDAVLHRELGVAYYNTEDWLRAYQELKKAIALNPGDRVAAKGLLKIETHFDLCT